MPTDQDTRELKARLQIRAAALELGAALGLTTETAALNETFQFSIVRDGRQARESLKELEALAGLLTAAAKIQSKPKDLG